MIINKKKIHNPARYLLALREGEGFYAAARVTSEKLNRLRKYGLQQEMKAWIPVPLGAATRLNADGKWIARKDLPKETRLFECEFRYVYRSKKLPRLKLTSGANRALHV